ncbi:MAG: hypothetical protein ACXWEV_04900 [Methylobacter sp.]
MFPKNAFLGAGLLLTAITWTPLASGEPSAEQNATAGRQYTPPGYVFSADIPQTWSLMMSVLSAFSHS